jgi:hypothetical protein
MSLLQPAGNRRPLHRRTIDVQVYARDDGHFDVEASLQDSKPRDIPLADGIRRAGEPLHDMQLHLVIDSQTNILAAQSQTRWMPYPGTCDRHGNAYERLVGLNLMKGFRLGIKERLSGTQGCTHLTELCLALPTAVIQSFVGVVFDAREDRADGSPPFQLDRCHALRRDGAIVQTHFPRWHRPARAAVDAAPAAAMPAIPS